jgi:hypothetical protein
MVLVIASAREVKARIAPAKAVITSHFVGMTFSLRVRVASNEWKSESIDPAISIQPLCKQPHGTQVSVHLDIVIAMVPVIPSNRREGWHR